jgi:phage-related baseplate assembly protein
MNLSTHHRLVTEAEPEAHFVFKDRPVDLTHLARYTMGNDAVEREVLELFRRQTRLYFDRLSQAGSDDAWREAARVLKASARGVGAWQILETAQAAEQLFPMNNGRARAEILRSLSRQVEEATQFIDSLL